MLRIYLGNKGVLAIEVLIVVSMVLVVLTGFFGAITLSLKLSSSAKESIVAANLVEEAIEGARCFRDSSSWGSNGLGSLAAGENNPYHLEKSSDNPPAWLLAPGQEIIGFFTREIIIENVSRDSSTGAIEDIYSSSDNDPETKKITVSVYLGSQKKAEAVTYLTNWNE